MRNLVAALGAAFVLALPVAASAGVTSQYFHAKSPLRYHVQRLTFSTTGNITASVTGVVPPGGAVLRDVVVSQAAAGDGTSWVANVKKNGTSVLTASGGFTAAAGANKTTNTVLSKMGALTNPTGGTRPVLDATKTTASGGDVFTVDVTLTGTYNTAVTGSVTLYFEPKY